MAKTNSITIRLTKEQVEEVCNQSSVERFKIPSPIFDRLLPKLDPYCQLLYLRLYRISHGYGKSTCTISLDRLAKAINVSKRTISRAVEDLEQIGLIYRTGANLGRGVKGNHYTVNLP